MKFADIIIICGHYGCGKTNLSMNMAIDYAAKGENVTLVDMDIVNPYFRSSDYADILSSHQIKLIAPTFAHSNLDLPSLPAEMYSIFSRSGRIIIDVGGDDVGATVLGRFSQGLHQHKYSMLYVINRYRVQSTAENEALELLSEIQRASRLEACGIVNNSHIMEFTNPQDIIASHRFALEVSGKSALPLVFTAVERQFADDVKDIIPDIYPIDIYVKKPWEAS